MKYDAVPAVTQWGRQSIDVPGSPSLRRVIAMSAELLWQADSNGFVTSVTPCRPGSSDFAGTPDQEDVRNLEKRWQWSVANAERFDATYRIRSADGSTHLLHTIAIPVLDEANVVRFWSGLTTPIRGRDADLPFTSAVSLALGSSLDEAASASRLAQAAVDHFCDLCAVHGLDEGGSLSLLGIAARRADATLSGERAFARMLAASDGLIQQAMRSAQPLLVVRGAGMDSAGAEPARCFLDATATRSLIITPLSIGASCLGTLTFLESTRPTRFDVRDVDLTTVVARQFGTALENLRLLNRERRTMARFRFLARVSDQLSATLDHAATLQLLLNEIVQEFADCAIAFSSSGDDLRVVAAAVTMENKALSADRLRDSVVFGEDTTKRLVAAVRQRHPLLVEDTAQTHGLLHPDVSAMFQELGSCTWIMVPLYFGDKNYGAIVCASSGYRYDENDVELLVEIGRRTSLALEHIESFERERRLVQTLQQATLPSNLAMIPGASSSAVYIPAARKLQVGGDWYDAFSLDDHRIVLSIGDVTGHGLEASIIMGKLRHAVNAVAMYEGDPARTIDVAEQIVLRRYPDAIATAFVMIIDSRTRTIAYANAGHPCPVVRFRDGSLKELFAKGFPIGLRHLHASKPSEMKNLEDAELLVFYTDGLTEVTRDVFEGERRLFAALGSSAIIHVRNTAEFVATCCLPEAARDDVAVLALNFVDEERWTFAPSDRRAARVTGSAIVNSLEAWFGEASAAPAFDFRFGRLISNTVNNARGPVDVALERRSGEAVLHVIARGTGGDGYEPSFIEQFPDELKVERIPHYGTHVSVVLPVKHSAPKRFD